MSVTYYQLNIVGLTLVILGLTACGVIDLKEPQVNVTDSQFRHVSLKSGRLDTTLSVSNPNVFKLPVKTLSYQLILNDMQFAKGMQDQGLKLAAGETRTIELPIDIHYQQLLDGIDSILRKKQIRFQLKGELDFGLIKVPFRKTGEFSL